jgi:hypothetical protein
MTFRKLELIGELASEEAMDFRKTDYEMIE